MTQQQHIKKIEKTSSEDEQKILFTEFGYSDQAAKNLGRKRKQLIT
jgi:hypothetical protein